MNRKLHFQQPRPPAHSLYFWGVYGFYLNTSLKLGLSCLQLKYNGARRGLLLKYYYRNTTGNCAMVNFNFPDTIWETKASNHKLGPSEPCI